MYSSPFVAVFNKYFNQKKAAVSIQSNDTRHE